MKKKFYKYHLTHIIGDQEHGADYVSSFELSEDQEHMLAKMQVGISVDEEYDETMKGYWDHNGGVIRPAERGYVIELEEAEFNSMNAFFGITVINESFFDN